MNRNRGHEPGIRVVKLVLDGMKRDYRTDIKAENWYYGVKRESGNAIRLLPIRPNRRPYVEFSAPEGNR